MTTKRTFAYFFVISIGCAFAQDSVGDSCTIKHTGFSGTCKIVSNCPVAEQQAQNGISPTICGFYQLSIPIVCCENSIVGVNENRFEENKPEDAIIYPENEPTPSNNRKSEQKCEEYSKSVTGVVQAIPLLTNAEAINVNVNKCEYNGVALIVGGKPAAAGEFPFMAAVGYEKDDADGWDWLCGGTLISEFYVTTAAHCVITRNGKQPKVVRLGELDFSSEDDGSIYVDYTVQDIVVHPKYRPPLKYNDIALLRMTRQVKFTKFIRPACLNTHREIDNSQAIATGWGKTDYLADPSTRLMKVFLNMYQLNDCGSFILPSSHLPQGLKDTMLCAGEKKGGADTCQGDSGGPLLVTKKGNQCKFYIIGITSFGKVCGQKPAIYTNIAEFVPWIEKTIW